MLSVSSLVKPDLKLLRMRQLFIAQAVVHNCFYMRFGNVIIITAFLGLFSCTQSEKLYTDAALEEKIKERVTSGQKTLDLKSLTDFDWDSLLILTPYIYPDKIEEQFGINLSRTKHTGIESRDDINQLIFFNQGGPIYMVEYPRHPGDFSINKIEFIQRDSAVFDIIVTTQKTVGGDDWIELRKR